MCRERLPYWTVWPWAILLLLGTHLTQVLLVMAWIPWRHQKWLVG